MSTALGMQMKTTALPLLEDKDALRVAAALSNVLAGTFILYFKKHNFHLNVTGPMFGTLHRMFEEQYNELWLAVDAIAERIRSLGFIAPGSYSEFTKLTYLRESPGDRKSTRLNSSHV